MKIIGLLAMAFMLCHCASVSTLQTGRVLNEGESAHSIGLGTYGSDDFLGGDDISLPLIEYTYRRGVWKDIDLGVKVAIIGSSVVDMKYNLVNGEKFALATGLGVGYLNFESELGTEKQEATIIDIIVPLYASYDVSKLVTLYTAPKYFYRTISADGIDVEGDGSMVSASLGVQWGKEAGVMLEGSLISGLDNDFSGNQFNFAYFFKL